MKAHLQLRIQLQKQQAEQENLAKTSAAQATEAQNVAQEGADREEAAVEQAEEIATTGDASTLNIQEQGVEEANLIIVLSEKDLLLQRPSQIFPKF